MWRCWVIHSKRMVTPAVTAAAPRASGGSWATNTARIPSAMNASEIKAVVDCSTTQLTWSAAELTLFNISEELRRRCRLYGASRYRSNRPDETHTAVAEAQRCCA